MFEITHDIVLQYNVYCTHNKTDIIFLDEEKRSYLDWNRYFPMMYFLLSGSLRNHIKNSVIRLAVSVSVSVSAVSYRQQQNVQK